LKIDEIAQYLTIISNQCSITLDFIRDLIIDWYIREGKEMVNKDLRLLRSKTGEILTP